MISFPNAKINIGLYIIEKRDDGFHNLETAFYPVNICDALEFNISDKDKTSFANSGLIVDSKAEDNIVMKAYELLKKDFNLPALDIHLHKNIPFGAGLGGGSADASFMIKTLNDFFKLKLNDELMESYAAKLGSDCSFFIKNKACFAHQKGDVFKHIDLDLSGYNIILLKPNINISTAEAYAGILPRVPENNLIESLAKPIDQWKACVFNDFEISLFPKYPILKEIKEKLYEQGAVYAAMSGSGSTVYAIFKTEIPNNIHFNDCFIWKGKLT